MTEKELREAATAMAASAAVHRWQHALFMHLTHEWHTHKGVSLNIHILTNHLFHACDQNRQLDAEVHTQPNNRRLDNEITWLALLSTAVIRHPGRKHVCSNRDKPDTLLSNTCARVYMYTHTNTH